MSSVPVSRRSLLTSSALSGLGIIFPGFTSAETQDIPDTKPNIFGPRRGYSPQIGIFVSELTWMRDAITGPVRGLTQPQLDWLFDKNANSIGALLLHLAATETFYQINTFDGVKWDSWPAEVEKKWGPASNLGDAGRATIKGHPLEFYLEILRSVREKTLAEFAKRDDAWLMTIDQDWSWGPTNNLCKWFHVCEHESHHNGQIELLIKRTPGYKPRSTGA